MRLRADYAVRLRWLQWTGNSLWVEWTSPRNCRAIEDLAAIVPCRLGVIRAMETVGGRGAALDFDLARPGAKTGSYGGNCNPKTAGATLAVT